jgi:hypothetical protein
MRTAGDEGASGTLTTVMIETRTNAKKRGRAGDHDRPIVPGRRRWTAIRPAPATAEEPQKAEGRGPGQDQADLGPQPAHDHRRSQPDLAGLVRVLQAQSSHDVPAARRLDPSALAQHPAQTLAPERDQLRLRQHQVAQCLLCRTRAFQLARRPCPGPPVLLQVNHRPETPMREICASGSAGGGREPDRHSLPLSSQLWIPAGACPRAARGR